MGLFSVMNVSAAGMDVQQARLEVAALNLANAQTTAKDGAAYKPLTAVVRSTSASAELTPTGMSIGSLPVPVVTQVAEQNLPPRLVFDPGHPDADERGFVTMPGVDPIGSMLDLVSISRAYEANLRAFDVTRSLLQKTLDIGSGR